MKERLLDVMLDVMKWGLILIVAGTVFYMSYGYANRYSIVGTGVGYAYKLNKRTGQVWFVDPSSETETLIK